MRLFYIDEFGNGDMSPGSLVAHPWSLLSAIVISDTARLSLAGHFFTIKDRFFPGWRQKDWRESEIKGRYLVWAIKAAAGAGGGVQLPAGYAGMDRTTAVALGREIGLTFAKFTPLIYAVGVNKVELNQRYGVAAHNPVAFAYVYLQGRASRLITEVHGSDEGVLLVADEQRGHEKLFSNGTVERVRKTLAANYEGQADFSVIFDKPLWVNKGELPADREVIQLADVACYLIGSAMRTANWNHGWLRTWILPYVAHNWHSGLPWGAGITVIPTPVNYPKL